LFVIMLLLAQLCTYTYGSLWKEQTMSVLNQSLPILSSYIVFSYISYIVFVKLLCMICICTVFNLNQPKLNFNSIGLIPMSNCKLQLGHVKSVQIKLGEVRNVVEHMPMEPINAINEICLKTNSDSIFQNDILILT
jgi:hypothetical protein